MVKKNKQWEWIPRKKVEEGTCYILNNPHKLYPVYNLFHDVAEERDTYPEDADEELKKLLKFDEEEIAGWQNYTESWCYVKKLIEKFEAEGESNYEPCVKRYIDAIKEDLLNKHPVDDLIAIYSFW
jgi:hypothetical protein